jgi:hypothetical protein
MAANLFGSSAASIRAYLISIPAPMVPDWEARISGAVRVIRNASVRLSRPCLSDWRRAKAQDDVRRAVAGLFGDGVIIEIDGARFAVRLSGQKET